MAITSWLICLVLGYLIGSIPTGYLIARAKGVNIQQVGSGNIGATNVLRSLGLGPAILVIVADPVKGALATLIPVVLELSPWAVAATGLAAVLGNNFNAFLKFRGGKGVATSIGVLLMIEPSLSLAALTVGLLTLALGRYMSLASLVGMCSVPLFLLAGGGHLASALLSIILAALSLYRHRQNIVRLAEGSERRFTFRATKERHRA